MTHLDVQLEDIESTLLHEPLSPDCSDECSPDCGACAALAYITDLHLRLARLPDGMARSWGHDAAWSTTGTKVANLVREWIEAELPECAR